jgi:hypothetical protein
MDNENPISNMSQELVDSFEKDYIQEIRKATEKIVGFMNSRYTEKASEGMWLGVSHTHKTLQQNFWRVVIELAEKYKDNPYDLQNEASVRFCKELTRMVNEKHIHLPWA